MFWDCFGVECRESFLFVVLCGVKFQELRQLCGQLRRRPKQLIGVPANQWFAGTRMSCRRTTHARLLACREENAWLANVQEEDDGDE
jgi:hypothetical protein